MKESQKGLGYLKIKTYVCNLGMDLQWSMAGKNIWVRDRRRGMWLHSRRHQRMGRRIYYEHMHDLENILS